MFDRANDFPLLKGKASEVRNLLRPMLDVCTAILKPDDRVHAQIVFCLQKLIVVEDILTENRSEYVLPADVAARFKRNCEEFTALNALLRRHFEGVVVNDRPVFLFHVTIKFHYVLHIADISLYMNPRLGWCYQGESLMHRVRILVQGSCHGVPAHMLGDKVMKKYCQGLAMLFVRERLHGEW